MKVAGEALELSREAQDKGLVQSGRPPSPTTCRAADEAVGKEQLAKMLGSFVPPRSEGG